MNTDERAQGVTVNISVNLKQTLSTLDSDFSDFLFLQERFLSQCRDVRFAMNFLKRLKRKLRANKDITFPSLKSNQHLIYVINSDYVQSNELTFEVKVNFDISFQPRQKYTQTFIVHTNLDKQLRIGIFPVS